MASGIEVHSIESLSELDTAFGRFGVQAQDILNTIIPELQRRMRALEERRHEVVRDVRHWEQSYHEAEDDDDISHARRMLEDAELKLREIERWQRRVDKSFQSFRSTSARLKQLASDGTAKAREFLGRKEAELQSYRAAEPSAQAYGRAAASLALPETIAERPTANFQDAAPVTEFPLPKGFRWVWLEEIDHSELPNEKDFSEGSYEEFRRRLELLGNEVLPVLRKDPSANTDELKELDRQRGAIDPDGKVHPDSLERTYELFFGDESIVLDRGRKASLFGFTSGRHRTQVAKDLGWPAIPAQTREPKRKTKAKRKRRMR